MTRLGTSLSLVAFISGVVVYIFGIISSIIFFVIAICIVLRAITLDDRKRYAKFCEGRRKLLENSRIVGMTLDEYTEQLDNLYEEFGRNRGL